ncbi:ribosome hibernation-promoting factor, HPF/YfiA family [Homoserinibacter sp. GY 40078]|uniref:ribosome hibernation-promoting factor, HPF/YfiA family n=1 Tax=Homoserinibacter sp. GY 40078 TaxID=2603275 RepID=UPI0011CA1BC6|nr:ribosome-associated translation inhibitor RaiA [Homoserinibacter sp. GY 40078]TXK16298.1 ribosome-associated translation inhibitor RaiA [Homoserinibacter sp. GY 40078]
MDVTISGRNVRIPDRFEDYVTEKSEKIEHLAPRVLALEVKVCRHHETKGSSGDDRVELTLVGPGPIVRAEAGASDKYAAFDVAFDKLVERIRQAKDRRKVHRGQRRPTSLREATADGFSAVGLHAAPVDVIEKVSTGAIDVVTSSEDEEWSPVVIREKVFPAELMTAEEAVDRMELVGHDFFLFIDARTDRPSVVYRRKGWDYGVIGLEQQELALAASR